MDKYRSLLKDIKLNMYLYSRHYFVLNIKLFSFYTWLDVFRSWRLRQLWLTLIQILEKLRTMGMIINTSVIDCMIIAIVVSRNISRVCVKKYANCIFLKKQDWNVKPLAMQSLSKPGQEQIWFKTRIIDEYVETYNHDGKWWLWFDLIKN